MVESELRLAELTDPDGAIGRAALALYESAFPVEERDPTDLVVAGIRRRTAGRADVQRTGHFMAALRGDQVAGITMFGYYATLRMGFLWFMAVQPALRNQGLGGWLLAQTLEATKADALALRSEPALGLCWEVERPGDAADEVERALRERRINFYRRNGAELIEGYSFTAPPQGDDLPPVPYHIMYLPVPGQVQPARLVLLATMIDAILLYGYDQAADSPYYKNAVARLASYGGQA